MRFGEELRGERERRGISLEDVSLSTRVSVRHLRALEEEQFSELPGGVFNKGIVRSYAQTCGMDPEVSVQKYVSAMRSKGMEPEGRETDWVEFAEAVHRSRVRNPRRRWRWIGVAAMVLGVLLMAVGVVWVLARRGVVRLPDRKRIVALVRRS